MGLTAVQLDLREPPFIRELTFGGVPVVHSLLDAGDLLAACDDGQLLVVERKTPADFLRTLKDGRLFPQLEALRHQSPWAYLVITGELRPGANDSCWTESRETGWRFSAVQGALLTCQELGISLVSCLGGLDYEATIMRLASRNRSALRVAPPRDVTILDGREALLAMQPGIGAEHARALLDHCGTPAWALDWLTDPLHRGGEIPGIGQVTKDKVRRLLGVPDELMLGIADPGTEHRLAPEGSGDGPQESAVPRTTADGCTETTRVPATA
jgi:ERCC4-type nuclease